MVESDLDRLTEPTSRWGTGRAVVAPMEVLLAAAAVIFDLFLPTIVILVLAAISLVKRRSGPASLSLGVICASAHRTRRDRCDHHISRWALLQRAQMAVPNLVGIRACSWLQQHHRTRDLLFCRANLRPRITTVGLINCRQYRRSPPTQPVRQLPVPADQACCCRQAETRRTGRHTRAL
jgi:hypothetical protein